MKLQGRPISLNLQGADVQLLQKELRLIGFVIDDKDGVFGKSTLEAVVTFQTKRGLKATGVVDDVTAKQINLEVDALAQSQPKPKPDPQPKPDGQSKIDEQKPVKVEEQKQTKVEETKPNEKSQGLIVRGRVSRVDGSPISGIIVRAFDKDLPSLKREELLGEAATDKEGHYEINYSAEQFLKADRKSADLIVRVFDQDSLLASSPIIFNASPDETVDVEIPGSSLSEYERYLAELAPVIENIQIANFTDEDVAFLNGETQIKRQHLDLLVVANKLAQDTQLAAEVFYGFVREDLPTNLTALLAVNRSSQQLALEHALRDNIIPARLQKELDQILDRLQQLVVGRAFDQPPADGKPPLSAVLATVLPAAQDQRNFVELYVKHEGPSDEFWQAVRSNPKLNRDSQVENLQFVLQLSDVAQNHLPLIQLVQQQKQQGKLKSLRDLAKFDEDTWLKTIAQKINGKAVGFPSDTPGANDQEKAKNYAAALNRAIEQTFPTLVIANRVEKVGLPGKEDVRADLVKFFSNSPDFDLGSTNIERYVAEKGATAIAGVKDSGKLVQELKGIQRLFKITPRFETIAALTAAGVHSSQGITQLGEDQFIAQFAAQFGSEANAKQAYSLANQTTATALAVFGAYSPVLNPAGPAAVPRIPDHVPEFPNWTELFGSLDLCACEHCRSVYGPAAYLVDLLAYLKNRPRNVQHKTPLQVLLERRPDIAEIELSCENTNTLLPYVDLVNEILEEAIAPSSPPHPSFQTRGTTEELRANPEHINNAAYQLLQNAIYPWTLPFDLWLEETRAYLNHLGARRYQLMKTCPASRVLFVEEQVAEYLQLSPLERQIITGAELTPRRSLPEFYGYESETVTRTDPENHRPVSRSWRDWLAVVPEFLDRTGLSFSELKQVLDTRFLNSTHATALNPPDDSDCDLGHKTINGLNDVVLQKLHRFIRLQRRLNWSITDFDHALTALGASALTDQVVEQLAIVKQLQDELQLSLDQLLSFWSPIETHGEDSLLDHNALLARALAIPVTDLLALKALTGVDPFQPGAPAITLAFVKKVRAVKDSVFSVAELNYIYRHELNPNEPLAPRSNEVTAVAARLREALIRIANDNATDPETIASLSRSAVKQTMAEQFNLSGEVVALLLEQLLRSRRREGIINDLLLADAPVVGTPPEIDRSSPAYIRFAESFSRLHKVALLIKKFGMTAAELRYLSAHGNDFAGRNPADPLSPATAAPFDLNSLPLASSEFTPAMFNQWERLADLFRLRDSFARRERGLTDVFGVASQATATLDEIKNTLAEVTGWDSEAVNEVVAPSGLNLSANDFRNEIALLRIQDCLTLARRIAVAPRQLFAWSSGIPDAALARDIRDIVRAKYDEDEWLRVAKPLRDLLREKQRSALVARLLAHSGRPDRSWQTADELFGYFLIDVEMSPCQMTSRIKQAISSVQLFVQRCLLGFENVASFGAATAWWKWMKSYRIWEANRKVFLYPENWIEPELRDDKTPFFVDLENELLQNEITPDTAETAYLSYLEKLDAVARLEICGIYHETDKLHVFGRTKGEPHIYYYRQLPESGSWTPWEKVEVDIQGDHLIPVIWERRLYLFWPIFNEKALTPSDAERSTNAEPPRYWEIKLAWSEYKNKKWSAKKMSKVSIPADPKGFVRSRNLLKPKPDQPYFFFKASFANDEQELIITCYWPEFGTEEGVDILGYLPFQFRFTGCHGEIYASGPGEGFNPLLPNSTQIEFMTFAEYGGMDHALVLNAESLGPIRTLQATPLQPTQNRFRIVYPHQYNQFVSQAPFFYQDDDRTFFISPQIHEERQVFRISLLISTSQLRYNFKTFYHPYVCAFITQLRRAGIDGLLDPEATGEGRELRRQQIHEDYFEKLYQPTDVVDSDYPRDEVDFDFDGSYSTYNWEVFFHAPLLIAGRLSKNQRFEEAQQWFHYIFDPGDRSTDVEAPHRYWKTRPFQRTTRTIDELMRLLSLESPGDAETLRLKQNLINQVAQWRGNPFNPHLIARLRITAYQKTVVMKYLDNLIAWGDQLFRRDTIESINEATQLYVLAALILGQRPRNPVSAKPPARTFAQLEERLDVFSNAVVALENHVPASRSETVTSPEGEMWLPQLPSLYFCIPNNEKLVGYWDTVADRLFKIRHCLNIEGVARELPLFEPPIDPGLLVRAAAAGIDLSSILSDISSPLPNYRFNVMVQKATELCNDVKALGAALLSALEKKDAEALALLRTSHEMQLLAAVRHLKQSQIDEATRTLEGLMQYKQVVELREKYYSSRVKKTPEEQAQLSLMSAVGSLYEVQAAIEIAQGVLHLLPEGKIGAPTTAGITYGGRNLGASLQGFAGSLGSIAALLSTIGSMSATEASHNRRKDDWDHQAELARAEQVQIQKQIDAATIRVSIAEKDLENHDLQAENSRSVDAFMRSKYTNQELYEWMTSQVSSLYFQSYQLAYDVARRAEKAFEHELASNGTRFIQFGYWDSLKKGLLAGERLHHDLKRMEMAYMDQHKREYEITKHISLAMLDPLALLQLKQTGECFVDLPELLFDLDYPGHFMRRIKSVSLTIPCVVGPYTSVNCTLTLLQNSVRFSDSASGTYARNSSGDGARFRDGVGLSQSIVTSHAQSDSGTFELNFRDERYLAFEGAGAISSWHIELAREFRQFDYDTISDLVLHVRYTSRNGGALKSQAIGEVRRAINALKLAEGRQGLFRLFSARREFSVEWHRFLHPADATGDQTLVLSFTKDRFPFLFHDSRITITRIELFMRVSTPSTLTLATSPAPDRAITTWNNLLHAEYTPPASFQPDASGPVWTISAWWEGPDHHHQRIDPEAFEDMFVVCHYSIS